MESASTEIPFSVGAKQVSSASTAFDLRCKKGEVFEAFASPLHLKTIYLKKTGAPKCPCSSLVSCYSVALPLRLPCRHRVLADFFEVTLSSTDLMLQSIYLAGVFPSILSSRSCVSCCFCSSFFRSSAEYFVEPFFTSAFSFLILF